MENSNLSLADKIEKFSYMRSLTSEEMEAMRIELTDKSIEFNLLENALKKVKDEFKKEMKPIKTKLTELLNLLYQKAEVVTEDCHVIFEQELGKAIYYNSAGVEVGSRPLFKDEHDPTILSELRKKSTNNK